MHVSNLEEAWRQKNVLNLPCFTHYVVIDFPEAPDGRFSARKRHKQTSDESKMRILPVFLINCACVVALKKVLRETDFFDQIRLKKSKLNTVKQDFGNASSPRSVCAGQWFRGC